MVEQGITLILNSSDMIFLCEIEPPPIKKGWEENHNFNSSLKNRNSWLSVSFSFLHHGDPPPKKNNHLFCNIMFGDLFCNGHGLKLCKKWLGILWLMGGGYKWLETKRTEIKRFGIGRSWASLEGGVQATPSSKPSVWKRHLPTFELQAVVWYGTVWFGLVCSERSPTSQKTKSSISLFQNSFVKAWSQTAKSLITDC